MICGNSAQTGSREKENNKSISQVDRRQAD